MAAVLIYEYLSVTAYHGSMDAYLELHKMADDPQIHTMAPDKAVNVCVGKEWHRFPGNLFLHGNQ